MKNPPTSFRLPFALSPDVHPDVQAAIRYAFSGLKDVNDAISAIVPKLGAAAGQVTQNIVTNVSGGGGGSSPSSIGTVNQQVTGVYSLIQADYGALVLLGTAATFAITLPNTLSVPFFTIIENECLGLATLTPTSGTINNVASYALVVGQFALVFFDGTNWWATTIAQTFPKIPKEWIDSYNAITGLFTASQPRASDLIDSTVGSGPVVLDSGATLINPEIIDSVGSLGLLGQVLESTGSGVLWVSSGGLGPNFADSETPAGVIDGVNKTFTLAHSPSPAISLELFNNGLLQHAGGDYTLSGNTITFVVAPSIGTTLLAWYRY